METKNYLNQITKTLDKLFSAGFNTEKKILAMQLEDLEKNKQSYFIRDDDNNRV